MGNGNSFSHFTDKTLNPLSDPPGCVGAEFYTAGMIKFFNGDDEAMNSFSHYILHRYIDETELQSNGCNQSNVTLNQFLFSRLRSFVVLSEEFIIFFLGGRSYA